LHRRLVTRAKDSAEIIERRMAKSWDEISHWDGYDYVFINDDIDETEERVKTIISATRMRRTQQPDLIGHIRTLQSQFEDPS
jgi:guanylate kinase